MNKLIALSVSLGFQPKAGVAEHWVAALGALLSILLTSLLTAQLLGSQAAVVILPSMGAAAVLLFAVPHGPMSQPWPLFCGNTVSAIIGVACQQFIPSLFLAAALAVGLAIFAMYLTRSVHPPGGATALAAVIGGDSITQLGFAYVWMPTLINCTIMFGVALVFNNLFAWRRYPLGVVRFKTQPSLTASSDFSLERIRSALNGSGLQLDVDERQFKQVLDQLMSDSIHKAIGQMPVEKGAYYTNGKAGSQWSVRQVLEVSRHQDIDKAMVMYKVVEGDGRYRSDSCSLLEFSNWAKERMRPVRK